MPGGRPTKRTPETADRICRAVRKGLAYTLACDAAGLSYETFNEWRKADPQFSAQLKAAEGEGAEELLATIRAASAENWTAAAWILERRYPQLYGRRVTELQGKDGADLKFAVVWPTAKQDDA